MASTYSPNLAIQLPATGDQSGQWGNTTNTNLGTLIESAISGVVTQTFADANIILPMPLGADGGSGSASSPVAARNMFIQCIGTNTAIRTLFLPANKKVYVIYNNTTGGFALTIDCITAGGTTVTLPSGSAALLVCDGTNVFAPLNYFNLLSASTTSTSLASAPLQLTTVPGGFVAELSDGTNTTGLIGFDVANHFLQVGASTGYGIELIGGGNVSLTVRSTGQVYVPAPSTTIPSFEVVGPAGTWGGYFQGSLTTGNSFGLAILAGTSVSDCAFDVVNYNDTTQFFKIAGDGSVTIGNPTGGQVGGVGALNAQALYINNSPVYSGAPVTIPNVNYGTVASDNGKILLRTTSTVVTYTIEDGLHSVGTLITFTNIGANSLLIGNTATTMVWSPSGATGGRTLAQFGTATAQKLTTGYWLISGSGLS